MQLAGFYLIFLILLLLGLYEVSASKHVVLDPVLDTVQNERDHHHYYYQVNDWVAVEDQQNIDTDCDDFICKVRLKSKHS